MSITRMPVPNKIGEEIESGQYQAKGERDYQQDRASIKVCNFGRDNIERRYLFVLCDGMGGMSGGERFSEIGVNGMKQRFSAFAGQKEFSIIDTLNECFKDARRDALREQKTRDRFEQGGSTLTAVIAGNAVERFGWLSSGDSRIYLYRNGLIQLSRDQNMGVLMDNQAALGRISWRMTKDPGQRRCITGGLGDAKAQEPDVCWVPPRLVDGDIVLLMSDGVFNTLDEGELSRIIEENCHQDPGMINEVDPRELPKKIIKAVLDKQDPKQDNCSVIGFRFQNRYSQSIEREKRTKRRKSGGGIENKKEPAEKQDGKILKENGGVFVEIPFLKGLFNKRKKDSWNNDTAVSTDDETTLMSPEDACPVDAGWATTQGKRPNQEDSCWFSPLDEDTVDGQGFLAAVSDGCGGVNNGEYASQAAVRAIRDAFGRQNPDERQDISLLKIAAAAQNAVLRDGKGGCATLVSVFLKDGKLWLLSIGDSRIALVRGGGMIVMNRPHIAGKKADEKTVLTGAAKLEDNRARGALSSCLGMENLQLIDRTVNAVTLNQGDQVLLMSDGVFNTLDEDSILKQLGPSASESAKNIIKQVDKCNKDGQDNATVVVLRIK